MALPQRLCTAGLIAHDDLSCGPAIRQAKLRRTSVDRSRREMALLHVLPYQPKQAPSMGQAKKGPCGFNMCSESNAIKLNIHHLRREPRPHSGETVRGLCHRRGRARL